MFGGRNHVRIFEIVKSFGKYSNIRLSVVALVVAGTVNVDHIQIKHFIFTDPGIYIVKDKTLNNQPNFF